MSARSCGVIALFVHSRRRLSAVMRIIFLRGFIRTKACASSSASQSGVSAIMVLGWMGLVMGDRGRSCCWINLLTTH